MLTYVYTLLATEWSAWPFEAKVVGILVITFIAHRLSNKYLV